MSEQLALQLEPATPCGHFEAFEDVEAAATSALSSVLLPASLTPPAEACAAPPASERCRERPRDLGDRLLEGLDQMVRKAEEAEQELRQLHADVLGIPVDQLDQHLAAEKAEEDRLRQEARASQPARASKGKAAKGGDAIGIGRAALSERQRELLAHIKVENNLAVYTSSERIPDWDLLKRVMVALGGTWKTAGKKSPGGFRFPDDVDAAEVVRLAQETGEITDPKVAEAFFTPDALADVLVERIGHLQPRAKVLEPSAGDGALVRAVLRKHPTARITCVEALQQHITKLDAMVDEGTVYCTVHGDFLQEQLAHADAGAFDAVAQNPPFSREIEHVRHAYKFLAPGGVLVAIMSAGIKYREDKARKAFRAWVADNDGCIWENPEGSFLESGTGVRSVMVRVRKGGV